MNRRFFCECLPEAGAVVSLPAEESYHVRTVLRGRVGDELSLLDGRGGLALAEVLESGSHRRDAVQVRILQADREERPQRRTLLYVAPPRPKQMSQVIRQATELGVWAIRPILTERSVSNPGDKAVVSWVEDARQACKQSGNRWLPEICGAVDLAEALAGGPPAGYIGTVPDVCESGTGAQADEVALWIGPEGGFTEAEEAAIRAAGAQPWSVGRCILRVETAVVAGLALIESRWTNG